MLGDLYYFYLIYFDSVDIALIDLFVHFVPVSAFLNILNDFPSFAFLICLDLLKDDLHCLVYMC